MIEEQTIPATQNEQSQESNNAPAYKVKSNGIEIAAWEHKYPDGSIFHSYTFQKSYKDKDGNWKQTQSLNRNDLLVLAELSKKTWNESLRV